MKIETTYIAEDGSRFEDFLSCKDYEAKLLKKKEEELRQESKRLSDAFLLSVGFDVEKYTTELEYNQALNISWLIFDSHGTMSGLKTCGGGLLERYGITCDFRYVSGDNPKDSEIMENWLKCNKLYGHNLCSFAERHPDFYKMDLLHMLENLCWEVKDGRLVNTAW